VGLIKKLKKYLHLFETFLIFARRKEKKYIFITNEKLIKYTTTTAATNLH